MVASEYQKVQRLVLTSIQHLSESFQYQIGHEVLWGKPVLTRLLILLFPDWWKLLKSFGSSAPLSFLTLGPFITLWVYLHYGYTDKALVHLKIWWRAIELVIFSFKINLNQKEDWEYLIQKVEVWMLRSGIYFSKLFTNPLHDASSCVFTKRKE